MKIRRRMAALRGFARSAEVLWILVPAVALLLLLAGPTGWLSDEPAKKNKRVKDLWTVQVREAQVREAPSFLSPVVFRAAYTSRVQVVDSQAEWRRIEVPDRDLSGWLLASTLIEKQLVLQAPNKKIAKKLAQKKEQSLAGRSFRTEVEKKLREKQKKKVAEGYVRLDQVVAGTDAVTPVPGEIALFRAEGGLAPLRGPDGQPVQVGRREPADASQQPAPSREARR